MVRGAPRDLPADARRTGSPEPGALPRDTRDARGAARGPRDADPACPQAAPRATPSAPDHGRSALLRTDRPAGVSVELGVPPVGLVRPGARRVYLRPRWWGTALRRPARTPATRPGSDLCACPCRAGRRGGGLYPCRVGLVGGGAARSCAGPVGNGAVRARAVPGSSAKGSLVSGPCRASWRRSGSWPGGACRSGSGSCLGRARRPGAACARIWPRRLAGSFRPASAGGSPSSFVWASSMLPRSASSRDRTLNPSPTRLYSDPYLLRSVASSWAAFDPVCDPVPVFGRCRPRASARLSWPGPPGLRFLDRFPSIRFE